jgi:hypothetical protein
MQRWMHKLAIISVVSKTKTPLYSEDDDKLLGFITSDHNRWQALTLFGYLIADMATRREAEAVLQQAGGTYLQGIWQYYDTEDQDWFYCVIKKAYEQMVIVNRTNALGFQDPEDYKQVVIEDPSETNLVKSS